MPDIAAITGFALASFCISIAPGPSWLYSISSTVSQGRRHGFTAVVGNGTGIVCHTIATAFGLSALMRGSPTAWMVLKIVGAVYLVWLGVRLIRQSKGLSFDSLRNRRSSLFQTWRDGWLVNLLNPKVPVLMLALMPQFIRPENGPMETQILLLGSVHFIVASSILSVLVILSGFSIRRLETSDRLLIRFQHVAGSIMIVLGAAMLW